MTRESVLSRIKKCPICSAVFLEEIGETCRCPAPEEPRIDNWEDIKKELGDCYGESES